MSVLEGHPHLRAIVQDLPLVVEHGKAFWGEKHPEALASQRIQFVPLDFMNEAPVANCDVYHVRRYDSMCAKKYLTCHP